MLWSGSFFFIIEYFSLKYYTRLVFHYSWISLFLNMQQITRNIYQIKLGMVNSFLIEDKGDFTLVDTGYKNSTDKIFEAIRKEGKNPDNIKRVILTHAHPDHSGSAAALKNKLNIPVLAHEEDAKIIEQGIGGRMPFVVTPGVVNWLIFNMLIKNGDSTIEKLKIDEKLKHNDVIPTAGGIQVIHTPGHSAGHIVLLVKEEGVLIAGDLCANVMGLALSTVYEDRPLGINSLQKTAELDFSTAVFGHGNVLRENANRKIKEKFAKAD